MCSSTSAFALAQTLEDDEVVAVLVRAVVVDVISVEVDVGFVLDEAVTFAVVVFAAVFIAVIVLVVVVVVDVVVVVVVLIAPIVESNFDV